jgi:hypothetical protein
MIMEFQQNGGSLADRDAIRKVARISMQSNVSTGFHKSMGRLVASLVDSIETNTLIQPFHWLRLAVASTETVPMYAMNLYNSEMREQKRSLANNLTE